MKTIAITRHRGAWQFQEDGAKNVDPRSEGYRSKADATAAAIAAHSNVQELTLTGSADKKVCRISGVKFRDPRGSTRRSLLNTAVNRKAHIIWMRIASGEISGEADLRQELYRLIEEVTE